MRSFTLIASIAAVTLLSLLAADVALAQETVRYVYDTRGRLIRVERTGTVNSGVTTTYQYDKVNNRRRVTVTGSPNPPPP